MRRRQFDRTPLVYLPSAAFVALAVVAHLAEPNLLRLPLSYMRDAREPGYGYAAFVSVVLAAWGYVLAYLGAPWEVRRFVFGPLIAAGLITAVALSPTEHSFHDGVTVGLFVWGAVFFAVRMLDGSVRRVVAYVVGLIVSVGGALAVGPAWGQKVFVLILLVGMNVDVWVMRLTTPRRGT